MTLQVKNAYDRQGLMAVGAIVDRVLNALCKAARPGMTTAALDRLAATLLSELGAEATPRKEFGFPGCLCISVNDEVVHGIPGSRILAEGDLVKLDLTADRRGFVADAARMIILGKADGISQRLADCARRACLTAIANAREGVSLTRLGGIIQNEANRDGFKVIKELCGHGVGRRTHEEPEVPNYPDGANAVTLRRGMVITIEPIISAGDGTTRETGDGWTLVTADGSRAGHYEETLIVGRGGSEVVTVS